MEPTVSLMPYLQSENCTRKTFFENAGGRAIKINIFDATNSTTQQGGIALTRYSGCATATTRSDTKKTRKRLTQAISLTCSRRRTDAFRQNPDVIRS